MYTLLTKLGDLLNVWNLGKTQNFSLISQEDLLLFMRGKQGKNSHMLIFLVE